MEEHVIITVGFAEGSKGVILQHFKGGGYSVEVTYRDGLVIGGFDISGQIERLCYEDGEFKYVEGE